jgi:adenylate kinase family enzyme
VRYRRVHIFGASGSGTTSLAAALSLRHGHLHLDTDDFYWLPTELPFQTVRPREGRLARLEHAIEGSSTWTLSGSLCGWGDSLIPRFDLVVFLVVPTDVRLARLRAREKQRYGASAIAPGGSLHRAHVEFMDWAARYDEGGIEMRSRVMHEAWLPAVPAPLVRLEGDRSLGEQLALLERVVGLRWASGGSEPRGLPRQ